MALAAPIISVQDGFAAAASNQANGATVTVTPGNAVTFALQSSTGVQQATMNITGIPGAPGPVGLNSPVLTPPGPFSWTVLFPPSAATCTLTVESTDGFNVSTATYTIVASIIKPAGVVHRARGVSAANNESLTAFVSVTGGTIRDGVTYAQGDIVLLTGQTSKSQNGLYQVGVVSSGTAPLTRIADFATGTVFSASDKPTCEIAEGTLFAGTLWKMTTTGAVTVDTTNHDWFPRQVTQSITLSAGTFTINNVPIFSTSKTNVVLTRTATGGTVSTTIQYCPTSAGANGLTQGIVGTGSVIVQATVAAGTIQNTDTSILAATIINF